MNDLEAKYKVLTAKAAISPVTALYNTIADLNQNQNTQIERDKMNEGGKKREQEIFLPTRCLGTGNISSVNSRMTRAAFTHDSVYNMKHYPDYCEKKKTRVHLQISLTDISLTNATPPRDR